MISETRDGELPLPYVDAPVGMLEYDGHEIVVWSLATTVEGKVIYLNCSAADAAVSATLKRLLRKSGGKATFQPTKGFVWSGPNDLTKLDEHYDTVTQALTHKGMRLKNMCVIPDSLNIAVGLSRPMESSLEDDEEPEDASSFRYVLGDVSSDRPPTGALVAHLQSLVVVCHQEWEAALWEHGKKRALLLPMPALGVQVWSISQDRSRWDALVGELWRAGALTRPAPVPLLSARRRSK